MKAEEVRGQNNAELARKLDDAYQELFNLRFQRATGKLSNSARFAEVKRDIARIKTILRERGLRPNKEQKNDA
ncbi:MAG: 50S ribosomal protein L29 [Caldilinea sp.]